MTIDHTTQPTLSDSVKTARLDAPVGANVLRVEPVLPDDGWDKGLMVDVSYVVHWPDGKTETGMARLDCSASKHPAATWSFVQVLEDEKTKERVKVPRFLDGAKIEAEAIPVGGKASLGVRITSGKPDELPAVRQRPKNPAESDKVR